MEECPFNHCISGAHGCIFPYTESHCPPLCRALTGLQSFLLTKFLLTCNCLDALSVRKLTFIIVLPFPLLQVLRAFHNIPECLECHEECPWRHLQAINGSGCHYPHYFQHCHYLSPRCFQS